MIDERLVLERSSKACPYIKYLMNQHYSKPKGFVGRQLIYRIWYGAQLHGAIAFGSAVKNLAGRHIIGTIQNGMNNTFYHVYRAGERYPIRNFTVAVLMLAECRARTDYEVAYGDRVNWIETLVELPRTGELYLRAGYTETGLTQGNCCKRTGGTSSDTWTGKRVWTKGTPKRVFQKVLA